MNNFSGHYKKVNGIFVYRDKKSELLHAQFKKSVKEGSLIDCYLEELEDDGTLGQLARVHASIRSLCHHIGENFTTMKYLVKNEAGLCIKEQIGDEVFLVCRSFGDCSYEDLSLAIEAAKHIGEKVNYQLR